MAKKIEKVNGFLGWNLSVLYDFYRNQMGIEIEKLDVFYGKKSKKYWLFEYTILEMQNGFFERKGQKIEKIGINFCALGDQFSSFRWSVLNLTATSLNYSSVFLCLSLVIFYVIQHKKWYFGACFSIYLVLD